MASTQSQSASLLAKSNEVMEVISGTFSEVIASQKLKVMLGEMIYEVMMDDDDDDYDVMRFAHCTSYV